MCHKVEREVKRGDAGNDPDRLPTIICHSFFTAWHDIRGDRLTMQACQLCNSDLDRLYTPVNLDSGERDRLGHFLGQCEGKRLPFLLNCMDNILQPLYPFG